MSTLSAELHVLDYKSHLAILIFCLTSVQKLRISYKRILTVINNALANSHSSGPVG